jgi:hypothetical protein
MSNAKNRLLETYFKLFQEGVLGPIVPSTVYSASQAAEAFRHFEDAGHIGKVVVTIPSKSSLNAAPLVRRIAFNANASYLLTGGVGGLGRTIAIWMVEYGARNLTFLSRSAGISSISRALFLELKEMGCSVTVVTGRADNIDDVREAIRQSAKPIKGVLHLAMVLNVSRIYTPT